MTAAEEVFALLNDAHAMLEKLDAATTLLKEVDDFGTLLELLHAGTELQAKLKTTVGSIHDRAWAQRGEAWGDYHHPDLGVVSVRRTSARPRWDHETITQRVLEQHMAQVGGEVTDPAVVAGWVLEAGALSYWRKGVLKELGIDVKGEDLHWSEPGNPSITFPSASG